MAWSGEGETRELLVEGGGAAPRVPHSGERSAQSAWRELLSFLLNVAGCTRNFSRPSHVLNQSVQAGNVIV